MSFFGVIGGHGLLEDGGNVILIRDVDKNGPPGFVASPAFQDNPSYDPGAPSGDDAFEKWANWADAGQSLSVKTATFKITAQPRNGSGQYDYSWSLPVAGTWELGPETDGGKTVYVAQIGDSTASNTLTGTVTDLRSGESYPISETLTVNR